MTAAPPRDFGFGEDEQLLRDLAHRFLEEHLPIERLRDDDGRRLVFDQPANRAVRIDVTSRDQRIGAGVGGGLQNRENLGFRDVRLGRFQAHARCT